MSAVPQTEAHWKGLIGTDKRLASVWKLYDVIFFIYVFYFV